MKVCMSPQDKSWNYICTYGCCAQCAMLKLNTVILIAEETAAESSSNDRLLKSQIQIWIEDLDLRFQIWIRVVRFGFQIWDLRFGSEVRIWDLKSQIRISNQNLTIRIQIWNLKSKSSIQIWIWDFSKLSLLLLSAAFSSAIRICVFHFNIAPCAQHPYVPM